MRFLILLSIPVLALPAQAQFRPPEVADKESGVQITRFIGKKKTLYNFRWTMTKKSEGGRTLVRFEGRGDNNMKGKDRIEWTEESLSELGSFGLRTLYWKKDSSGAERESWHLKYDWRARKLHYSYANHLEDERERETVDLGKKALPTGMMYVLLRGFPFEKGEDFEIEADFILSDGDVVEGAIVHCGEERIRTAFGVMGTYKLEMEPSGLTGVFAPSMYMWFTKSKPHLFVRFDGKDAGYFESRTTNVLVKYDPAKWIHQ
jgi:hypothetical protein